MSLMYSGKDEIISRSALVNVPTPRPSGPRHHPLSFDRYMSVVEEQLDKHNIQVTEQEYVVTADHMRMFGTLAIKPQGFSEEDSWGLILGVRGAHDKRFARGITLGTRVTVCSNLMFTGDLVTMKTKQTTFIEHRINTMVHNAVTRIPVAAEKIVDNFQQYRDTPCDLHQGDAFIVEIFRRGALNSSQLGRALTEWKQPTHDYGPNVYTLMNCCTEVLKPTGERVNMDMIRSRSSLISSSLNQFIHAA